MSIDEMINWIADRDHLHEGTKIIAALKAGSRAVELLRNLQEGGDIGGITEAHDERIRRDIDSALDAWDKATKDTE